MPFYSIALGASIHMIDLIIWLKGFTSTEVIGYGSNYAMNQHQLA